MNRETNMVVFRNLCKDRRFAKADLIAALNDAIEPIRFTLDGETYEARLGLEVESLEIRRVKRGKRPEEWQGC